MDNNILAMPSHFEKIAAQITKENLSVDFNQGLDIRLLNDKNAKILSELNVQPYCRFAFDDINIEPFVIKGLALLKKYNIKHSMWYVLVGFNTTFDQDMHRLKLLKDNGQRAYVMRHENCRDNKKYNDLSAWVNQVEFFKSMDFETFVKCRRDRTNIIKKNKNNKSLQSWS